MIHTSTISFPSLLACLSLTKNVDSAFVIGYLLRIILPATLTRCFLVHDDTPPAPSAPSQVIHSCFSDSHAPHLYWMSQSSILLMSVSPLHFLKQNIRRIVLKNEQGDDVAANKLFVVPS